MPSASARQTRICILIAFPSGTCNPIKGHLRNGLSILHANAAPTLHGQRSLSANAIRSLFGVFFVIAIAISTATVATVAVAVVAGVLLVSVVLLLFTITILRLVVTLVT